MKQMFVVMKETYIRQVKSWSFLFMVFGPFLFLGLGVGIGYLTDSSTDAKNQVALVTEVPAVKESLKGTDNLTLDYKDKKQVSCSRSIHRHQLTIKYDD